ncbi:hypothetical protein LCGC14_1597680 [marine sediment metagenome]|uniref:Uncharacterized protein n=1 Tax=marine sediment metagenome TaxID=412755 RepID=A0A0F9IC25_9ZZZZ
MWNSDHTPELLGKLKAEQFPATAVTVYLGETVPVENSRPPYDGYAHFENAFWQREGAHLDFYVVYTEHLGYFVFFTNTILEVIGLQYPYRQPAKSGW